MAKDLLMRWVPSAWKVPWEKLWCLRIFRIGVQKIFSVIYRSFLMMTKKAYHLLQLSEIEERYHNTPLPIKCSTKLHICFHANGSVQAKVNLCSCSICLVGDFVKCPYEKGSMVLVGDQSMICQVMMNPVVMNLRKMI